MNAILNGTDVFTPVLILPRVTEKDTGTYTCRGTLEGGKPFVATTDVYVGGELIWV